MKKLNFTQILKFGVWSNFLKKTFPCLFFLSFYLNTSAQPCPPALSCDDQTIISLPGSGNVTILPDMLLEGLSLSCNANYNVEVTNQLGEPLVPANQVDCDDIGATLTATISDSAGNTCWSSIQVEDKFAPTINCFPRVIDCTQDVNNVAFPTASDNCSIPSLDLTILELLDDVVCDDNRIVYQRTFIANDDYGNSSTCTELITLNRPTDIDFPDDITWHCDQYEDFDNIIAPTPLAPSISDSEPGGTDNDIDVSINTPDLVLQVTGSGAPTPNGIYCEYGFSSSDEIISACDYPAELTSPVFKIIRTWTALDWCSGNVIFTNGTGEDNKQTIKVADKFAPTINLPAAIEVQASTPGNHPIPCLSEEFILIPAATDNCSGVSETRIYTPIGEAVNGIIPSPGLAVGTYQITVSVTDNCGNNADFTTDLNVVDKIAPSVICDEITDVNLSSDGDIVVDAIVFDDGSTDNCCIADYEVRRMDNPDCPGNDSTAFAPTVPFYCCDAATTVMVELKVTDCYDNSNTCMVEVLVNDKLRPTLASCPADVTITCEDFINKYEAGLGLGDLTVMNDLGVGTFVDNCSLNPEHTVNNGLDQCVQGEIQRTWRATDQAGNQSIVCNQRVTVEHVSDWAVMFPDDVVYECDTTGVIPDFGEPVLYRETCELLAVSYNDEFFNDVVDACYKINRTWRVINWCTAGDEIEQDILEPSEASIPDADFNGNGRQTEINDPLSNPAFIVGHSHRTFREDLSVPDGFIEYAQVIKVKDSVSPVFNEGCAIPDVLIFADCDIDFALPIPGAIDCSDNVDVIVSATNLPPANANGIHQNVVPGVYDVDYRASDNCGNYATCKTTVNVIDEKNPTPYCIQGLIVTLMNTNPPMIEIWANDFDAGSFDNCGPVDLSFSTNVNDTSMVFMCEDVGEQLVTIWVTDIYGNNDFCETVVQIQDNIVNGGNNCGIPLVVGGNISNEDGEPVKDVNVSLSGANTASYMTGDNGNYEFPMVEEGNDYSIIAQKDLNPLNGVTTYDLVLISKHVLGTQALDSPYKMIAADANRSGEVTTFDLVTIRKVILFINDGFTGNTSWRFVDANHTFSNPADPFAGGFPELLNFNNIPSDELSADFVAIKIGDVNSSSNGNELLASDDRSFNGQLTLHADDLHLSAGQPVTIDISAADVELNGFQFTIDFDPSALSFSDLQAGLLSEENFGLNLLEEGAITVSWHQANAVNLSDTDVLFSLVFDAQQNTQLSEVLSINSKYTVAEAYEANGDVLDVNLDLGNHEVTDGYELYQNRPNPFGNETVIGFTVPTAATATLTISDVSGRVLKVIDQEFVKGYNEVSIEKSQLQATGVLYYQLETNDFSATKMMVVF